MTLPCAFPLQRAKIGQGTKAPEEKTTNTISKSDTNGNRDRMKLTDFNFLMVLGKGSFGKVRSGVAAVLQKGLLSRQARLLVVGGFCAREGASEKQIDVHHTSPWAPGGKWIGCCATNKPSGDPLRLSEEVTCKWRPEGRLNQPCLQRARRECSEQNEQRVQRSWGTEGLVGAF